MRLLMAKIYGTMAETMARSLDVLVKGVLRGIDRIDKWEFGENVRRNHCISQGGGVRRPGFRTLDQKTGGPGGGRGKGQAGESVTSA